MPDPNAYTFEDSSPEIHEDARVSVEATLVGDVSVAAEASVWPGVVLRGDVGPVRIGRRTHVGDTAVLHGSTVERGCMVGHGSVLDEATVDEGTLVGSNATLHAGVTVGEGSIVASGTVIQPRRAIPPDSFVRGVPAEVTPLSETDIDAGEIRSEYSSGAYTDLANRHGDLFG